MRKHLLLFFSALLFIVGCSDKKKDDDIIDQDKMVNVLTDVHIVDGSLLGYGSNDSLYKYGTNRYAVVFKKHGVDSATFNKSLKYYAGEPEVIIKIYEQVEKILTAKADSTGKLQAQQSKIEQKRSMAGFNAEQKRKADSLKRDSANAAKIIKLKSKGKVL